MRGFLGLPRAFGPRDLDEQKALVGEVAVEGRLADAGGARDGVDARPLVAVGHEDPARPVEHLIVFPALPARGRVHAVLLLPATI